MYQCLKDYLHITEIYIYFDNEDVGQLSAEKVMRNVASDKYNVTRLKSEMKDWNEDLLKKKNEVKNE